MKKKKNRYQMGIRIVVLATLAIFISASFGLELLFNMWQIP